MNSNSLRRHPPEFKKVEFRNKVIHKGMIPNLKDTHKYARHIFELIKGIYIDAIEYAGDEFLITNQTRELLKIS